MSAPDVSADDSRTGLESDVPDASTRTGLEPEERLQQLQRLAMLGTLASGIGHDLRNLVMPMLLRLDVLAASPEVPERARGELTSIRGIVTQLQRLASGLRMLSTDPFGQKVGTQSTALHEWWGDMQALVGDALPPHAALMAQIPDTLPLVAVPPDVLAQVVVNVVMNSRRAMEDTPRPQLTLSAHADGETVQLSIMDNGRGMDAETRLRCFEPFFTTRTRDFATGLGLSVGRALMNRYGGDLTLEAKADAGATFKLHMPIARQHGNANATIRRRVRLQLSDPRLTALLRMIVANKGLEETAPGDTESVDFTVCDIDSLAAAVNGTEGARAPAVREASNGSRIVLIGTAEHSGEFPGVIRVDPSNIASLSAVLNS